MVTLQANIANVNVTFCVLNFTILLKSTRRFCSFTVISCVKFHYFIKTNKKVLPIYCSHFANLEGTRCPCFVFTSISTSYLTSVKPNLSWTTQQSTFLQTVSDLKFPKCLSNYSRRITNHPFRTFTVTSGHVFMGRQLTSLMDCGPPWNP